MQVEAEDAKMKRARSSVYRMVGWSCVALSTLACSAGMDGGEAEQSSAVRQAVSDAPQAPGGPGAFPRGPGRALPGGPGTPSAGVRAGEIIVKYKSDGAQALTECAERWIREGRSFGAATADGSASLDTVQHQLGVRSARALMSGRRGLATRDAKQRLAAAHKVSARRAGRQATAAGGRTVADLVNLYVLELPQQVDVVAAARSLAADPHVEYAQPNYLAKADFVPNDPYFPTSGS
jgi:hypothetical protein